MSRSPFMPPKTLVLARPAPWLLSARWDLFFLIGSAVLVPLPLFIKNGLGLSVTLVNLIVTILIGGPHLFATFTYTLMERRFWKSHPCYAAGAFLIPPAVIFLGLKAFGLLISIFFFWASVHILHQICYIADCYRERANPGPSHGEKVIDYALVFTSLYPMAAYKLVQGTFHVAGQNIAIPFVQGEPLVFISVLSLFLVFLSLFVGKTFWDLKRGEVNLPKTLLISVTVVVSFFLPTFKELDVVFQGFNTWHSLQYIALAWWINVVRKEKGEISSPLVHGIAGRGRTKFFYASCLIPTLAFMGFIVLLARSTSLPFNQCYFIVVLSGLLAHYYFDHWVFTRVGAVVPS